MLENLRFTQRELEELIHEELPGVRFTVESSPGEFFTTLTWERRVDGLKVAIDDVKLPSQIGEAELTATIHRAIDDLRRKAMADYGLQKMIDRQKAEIHQAGFNAMVQNLRNYISNNMKEYVPVLNEDEVVEYVARGVNREGQRLLAWIDTLHAEGR